MTDYTSYSDIEWADLVRSADDRAFKEIYDRYNKLLYLFAYNKLRNKEEAKDVVQDVFAWVLNNRTRFAINSSVSSFLYKSVLNKIFDIFRHQSVIRKYIEQGDHYIDIDSTETDYLIREKDIAQMIRQEIDAMPQKMKEVYLLRFEQYLSAKEIAEQLNISENTVNTHLKRAAKKLRDNLGMLIYVVYIMNR
ncbi:DNA-directed RNA polymerase sigma-70 factor [Sphingobacterium mizutaii NBRC 14946 = DSM 11724]|uniref:RNA polymerase sigma factor sigX n=2 Tax=Sphingobacterium mizutaii TaxID=1010 RepID=A0AAJ5C1R3_9SPHI|nr:RNA polymerase sigma-70 factor [Sphingobacterium mizutaii]MBV2226487.1 RNA polymerase sigma-70 factor [Sphingobacterium mizutaii]GEM66718.1 DNA-directed RNA polymerase sigma-70 factor [Sphingobacterium mizutaii NBRC 14946 = DSM 11724]SDL47926.1 RNA polymerase sigma-70 factor, Bacteroides expansion family 1 [Sphingobacterium mizutaii]SNV60305.1 RNA polymerase sigma factor sigX [Sphingobacterium mizutaii]